MKWRWLIALSCLAATVMGGCGQEPPVRPNRTDPAVVAGVVEVESIAGFYHNRPRLPEVVITVNADGTWDAVVYPSSGFTCRQARYSVQQPMFFNGTGMTDTTSTLAGFWQGGVTDDWMAYGYIQAGYRNTWPARDRVVGPIIEGSWVMSVYGDCMAAQTRQFWLKPDGG